MRRNGILRAWNSLPLRKRLPNKSDPLLSIEPEIWDITGRPPPKLESDPTTGWTQKSRRVGVLAQKIGMTHTWDAWMSFVPLTAFHIPDCRVTQVKNKEQGDVVSVQVAAGYKKRKNIKKPQAGHLVKAGVNPTKPKMAEFRVTEDALVPLGTRIGAGHFIPGQYVDIIGVTKGKGTQGAMKKWGFSGGNASHGNSISHRSIGSTGNSQDPGKVWKGKKMAGEMGNTQVTIKNCLVYRVDPKNDLVWVKGAVPGNNLGWLRVQDARFKQFTSPPPFPTATGKQDLKPKEVIAPKPEEMTWVVEDVERAEIHYKEVEREKLIAGLEEKEVKRKVRRKAEKKERKSKKVARLTEKRNERKEKQAKASTEVDE